MAAIPDESDPRGTATWRRAPRALWRRSGERTLVLCPGQDRPLVISGAGQAIWELLADPIEERALVSVLAEAVDADRDRVGSETRAFLEHLASESAAIREPRPDVGTASEDPPAGRADEAGP
jgi:hypothetical protein